MSRAVRLFVLAILCLSLVPAAYANPTSPQVSTYIAQDTGEIPYIEWDECPFLMPSIEVEGDTLDCGYMITLEDPFDADSELIEIAFAILYSDSDDPAPDPVVYLEGGPGGSALAGLDWWLTHPIREERDIVLLDQRGTGFSLPSLNCEEEEDYAYDPEAFDEDYDAGYECYQRLVAEGIDLANYNTVTNAYDVADLIELLDYAPANLLGISYGTRLALAVMRDHPDLLRSVIIDSVYPANIDAYAESGINTEDAFARLFERCAADAACNSAYPDLETVFYKTVNDLNSESAIFSVYDDWEEADIEIEMIGDDLMTYLFESMYVATIIPALPAALYYFAEGDYATGYDLLTYGPPDVFEEDYEDYYADYGDDELDDFYTDLDSLGDAEGMFDVLECQDEWAYNDYDLSLANLDGLRPEIADISLYELESMSAMCEYWLVEPAPEVENQAVVSDIPTLVMTGELDPVTPPVWGEIAAKTLSNHFYFEFPGLGHSAIDDDCALDVALQFLDDPTTEPDASCIAGMTVDFYIR